MGYFMNEHSYDRDKKKESRIMHRGEIYYCYNNYKEVGSELHHKKGRPCILVSKEDICINSPIVTVVYLSASPKTDYPTHVIINNEHMQSTAIGESPNSVSKARLSECVGKATEAEMRAIDKALAEGLDLEHLMNTNEQSRKLYEELLITKAERDTYKRIVDSTIKSNSK